jgi:uncharacterized membrane protein
MMFEGFAWFDPWCCRLHFPLSSFETLTSAGSVELYSRSASVLFVRLRRGPSNLHFHLMLFPTTSFLSNEEFGVVVMVGPIPAIKTGARNFLSHPSLASGDGCVTVVAIFHVRPNHWFSPDHTLLESSVSRCSLSV